jgi:hypothetical protein
MIYVHKRSDTPIQAWDLMRRAGLNTIAPQSKGKYLLMWNVEVIRRDGMWHYIFEFNTRDSLEMSPLSQMVRGNGQPARYRDGMNWKQWLGQDWELVTPQKREELLLQAELEAQPDHVTITGLKVWPEQRPRPAPAQLESASWK